MTPAIVAVAIASITVGNGITNLLLEPDDPSLDVVRLIGVEAITLGAAQPVLDVVGFVAKTIGAAVADSVAAVEPLDLILDGVDPRLKRAHLAEAVAVAVIAIVIAVLAVTIVGVGLRLGLRIILGRGGRRECESRTDGSKGKNDLTHNGSPV